MNFCLTKLPFAQIRQSPYAITTCSSQLTMLTTVQNDSIRIRKRIRQTVGLADRVSSATTRAFTKDTTYPSMVGGQHGMFVVLAKHSMARAQHGICELVFKVYFGVVFISQVL
jgi:hypothetical protein